MARVVILVIALVFTAFFAVLTLDTVAQQGVSAGTVIALVVIALFVFGIIGALRNPPPQ